jgi:thiol-disulfide isomerase/thioredoxin
MRIFPVVAAVLALTACQQKVDAPPAANETAAEGDTGGVKGIHRDNRGKLPPDAVFSDGTGKSVTIADFKGKPVLVNLWASWCAPCVKELPTLDKLAASGKMEVLAVSQDTGPEASVAAFLKEHGIAALKPYHDEKMGLSGALGPDVVLPTSILFDANGKEVWRYVGDLDWTSPVAAKLLAEAHGAPSAG